VRAATRLPTDAAVERERARARAGAEQPVVERLLGFQSTAGNRAVAALLRQATPTTAVPIDPYEELDRKDAEKSFDLAAKAYAAGDFAHAYDFFTRSHELFSHADILFSAAQALRRLGGRRAEAIALYERYLASGGTKRKKDAEGFIAELTGPGKTGDEKVDRKAAEAVFDKGAAHYQAGRYAHAFDEFSKSYELYAHPDILFSAAQALRRLGGRREETIALYEQYLATGGTKRKKDAEAFIAELKGPGKTGDDAVDRKAAEAAFDRAAAHYKAGRFAHAFDEFCKSHELYPHPDILFSAAQALRRLGGRSAEAIALYEQYLATGGTKRKKDAEEFVAKLRGLGAAP
jgi:tetratricopeptide (TPR) repeat protein